MTIYISKDGQQYGPYTIADAQGMVANGTLSALDWAWYEGITEWIPLQQVPGFAPPAVVETEPELPFMAQLMQTAPTSETTVATPTVAPDPLVAPEPVAVTEAAPVIAEAEIVAVPTPAAQPVVDPAIPPATASAAATAPTPGSGASFGTSSARRGGSSAKRKSSSSAPKRKEPVKELVPTGPRPNRPILVWIICLLLFIFMPLSLAGIAALPTFLNYVANHQQTEESDFLDAIGKETDPDKREQILAAHRELSSAEVQLSLFRSHGLAYYALPVAILLVLLIAAVFLFRLQKLSLYLFIAAFVLSCVAFVLNGIFFGWHAGGKVLFVTIGTWVVMLALIYYVWHLGRKEILR